MSGWVGSNAEARVVPVEGREPKLSITWIWKKQLKIDKHLTGSNIVRRLRSEYKKKQIGREWEWTQDPITDKPRREDNEASRS